LVSRMDLGRDAEELPHVESVRHSCI